MSDIIGGVIGIIVGALLVLIIRRMLRPCRPTPVLTYGHHPEPTGHISSNRPDLKVRVRKSSNSYWAVETNSGRDGTYRIMLRTPRWADAMTFATENTHLNELRRMRSTSPAPGRGCP